ncbi:MAG: endonuclease domain-containing protein, partial [Methylophagaceae bacterium]
GDVERKLFFDHCHETKQFRGWLCPQCNFRVGTMGDTPEKIKYNYKKIMEYLNYV